MDKNCKNCLFRERSYSEYPCEKCRNGNNWTPSDNLLEFAIEELEKTKEEIGEAYPYFDSADVHWGFNICRDILDKHIKELKGEQNK